MVYELKNKIPQNSSFLNSEDVLTGTIFGSLRYFRNQNLLINFLNESIDINGNRLKINGDSHFEILFWEKYPSFEKSNSYNEPDLVLYNNNEVVIIECKYFSILDEETLMEDDGRKNYKNQLIRYASIIDEYYKNRTKKNVVFLTNDKSIPLDIMNNTIKHKDIKYEGINFYWLSWKYLYSVIQLNYSFYSSDNILLLSDLLNFLKKRHLYFFNGFNIEKTKYNRFYRKNYNFEIKNYLFNWKYVPKLNIYFSKINTIEKNFFQFYERHYFSKVNKYNFNWRYENE